MKRVFNFCGGQSQPHPYPSSKRADKFLGVFVSRSIHHVSSVEALLDHIPDLFIDDLGYAGVSSLLPLQTLSDERSASLEHEMCDEIDEATIKVSPLNPNQPAVIRLAVSHVRITCVSPFLSMLVSLAQGLKLSPGGAVEIIPMADISDAYVTGLREKNEFIIRRNKQGTTLYLSSPSNDHIVKVRSAFFLSVIFIIFRRG